MWAFASQNPIATVFIVGILASAVVTLVRGKNQPEE